MSANAGLPGHFGPFGGRYVPETLVAALEELEEAWQRIVPSEPFRNELDDLLRNYAGRPTALTFAKRMSDELGGGGI